MSIFANPVSSVLFPTGDLLAVGDGIEDLGVGDIGVFDADKNLAINAAGAPNVRAFYVAVGLEGNRVARSSGQSIRVDNVLFYEGQCHTECTPQVSEITDFNNIACGRNYAVRFVVSDPEGFINYGYQPINKTFVINTDNCPVCEDCEAADCNQFAVAFRHAVNNDPEGLFTVGIFAATDTNRATDLTDAQVLALQACPVIQVTSNCGEIKDFCKIPENYTFPRGTRVDIAFPEWESAIPTVQVTQALVYEQGAGYDAKFKEFVAQGFDGSPYRITESGVQFGGNFQAKVGSEYITINIGNKFVSNSNPSELNNGGTTAIYLDCDGGYITALTQIFDALLPGFAPLHGKLSACDCI